MNKRTEFLNNLRSPSGKTKYKRYLGSPLRYAGGKSLAVGYIVELIPDDVQLLVSPFLGGGSVEVACAIELNMPVIGFDIFNVLINYWNVQLNHPDELYKRLKKFKPDRDTFKVVKERLKLHWTGKNQLGTYDLAAYYYFNHNTSFGPHFLWWPSSIYLQDKRYQNMIEKVRNFKTDYMAVGCAPFKAVMDKYDNNFLYCDPPYYLDGDSKTFTGLYPNRNNPIHHKGFDHEMLCKVLKAHKGRFILSYNDCSVIREWYKDFEISTPSWQYTMGQNEMRMGKNRQADDKYERVKDSHELLIWNY